MIKRLGFAILITILLILASPWGRAGVKSGLLLLELAPKNKFKPLSVLTFQPQVEEVDIVSGGRVIKADIWKPRGNSKRPAAIIAYGIDIPKDKEELVKLAGIFARLGFVVLVPNVPELLETRYVESEVEDFINIFQYLKSKPYVDTQKMGFVSFCIGSSLALLAAEDVRIVQDVRFIFVKSVYVDTFAITRDTMTRTLSDARVPNFWQPQEKLRLVVIREMTDFVQDGQEKALMREALISRKPLSQGEVNKFSLESQAMYNYLANENYTKAKEFWEQLPASIRAKIDKVSPIVNIDRVKAKVFILAATSDIYLPYTESEKLYKLLPKERVKMVEAGYLDETGNFPKDREILLKQGMKLYKYFFEGFWSIYNL